MATFDQLVPGAIVLGLEPQTAVTIIAANAYNDSTLALTWRTPNGNHGERMLYKDDAAPLTIQPKSRRWAFDADGALLRLVSEAWRIHYAHLFDPYLAIHNSDVEPLPHQISAVYEEMLGRLPLRYVLADDPGAGKTIMTGLFIKELIARGDLGRCLIICPGSLAEQWQDELFQKFHLPFEILNNDSIESAISGNIFTEKNLAIARLDKLARDEALQEKLANTDWDLIVCDEAHKMSATIFGGEVKMTKRFQLGRLLSSICRNFLLLTATPHNGKEEDFQLFLSLIDQDRFDSIAKTGAQAADVSDVMRRLVKEDLLKFDGNPLFPDRQAISLNYSLSKLEAALYEAVTAYVQSEFNRADNLGKKQRVNVGFALTVLQRRLASSPEAIYQSLRRRRERMQKRLQEERLGKHLDQEALIRTEDFDEDDFAAAELEELEDKITDQASAARTVAELEAEIETLLKLEKFAGELRASGTDRKWEELSGLLQEEARMFDNAGIREKLIIFTEHRDTLRYLADKIRSLLGNEEAVVTIYGGMRREERRKIEERFKQDKTARILVATDAAGEGINLQRSHLMVNYDLPWNPNRLEQRFGRIHRIGQNKTCWLWNLVAAETREGAVFQRLFEKLEQEKAALGGKVFDILGKVSFNNRPLRELLIEAVRYNETSENSAIKRVIEAALDRDKLQELIRENALTEDFLDAAIVTSMREEMERLEARRLQPHYIEAFFKESFKSLGGKMASREAGRYEITYVPAILRNRPIFSREPVLTRYERVCFDKEYKQGAVQAALICPGHPLLDAIIDLLRQRNGDVLKRGAILIDREDPGEQCRLLFYLESAIQDGTQLPNGKKREISRQIHFVELNEQGFSFNSGYAPYLNYQPANEAEHEVLLPYIADQQWLNEDVETKAIRYAAIEIVPRHLSEVRERKLKLIDKTEKAVRQRLTAGIQYWDYRAAELRQRENSGKRNAALHSSLAQRRAEDLAERLERRMADLERERQISALPPQLAGGCLVVPQGLLNKLLPEATPPDFCANIESRKKIEAAAMAAVMAIEKELGYLPSDVSRENRGYDIESQIPADKRSESGEALRFLEVKGRAKGAKTVTVTYNEIISALNRQEQFLLALVEVDGDQTSTIYLKRPFKNPPDFATNGVTYDIAKLLQYAEKVYPAR